MPSETIYTPEGALRHPVSLLREMWRDLLTSREIAWRLMRRDISAQYRQSFFGFAWAFLPPLAMGMAFTFANNAKLINIGETDLPYTFYVIFNTILWQTFVEALNGPVNAVTGAKPLLARINLPREAVVLAKLGEVCFNSLIKLFLVAALFAWFRIGVGWATLLAPFSLLILILLGTCLGLLLAPFGGLYEDILKGLPLATGFWLFLTPVIYPVPGGGGAFASIVRVNPVTPLLVTTRELATAAASGVSSPARFVVVSLFTLFGLGVAWVIYRLAMPFVVERVSS
jgi:lipopolysaccharide transport system permease protein